MAMNFPDSPSNGDTVTLNGKVYTYETTRLAWTPAAPGAAAGATTLSELTDTTISTTNPAIDSNPTSGLGHTWINKTSGEQYILVVATAGANEWFNVGDGTGRIQPVPPLVATGGTVSTSGGYTYHTFTSSDTFTFSGSETLVVDYLVVAGGASGGNSENFGATGAGGGGAGGYIAVTGHTMSPSTNAIVIGSGGASQSSHASGNNGSNSSFLTSTAIGGGSGAGGSTNIGSGGGSGGGGNNTSGTGGAGTGGQGFAGGASAGSDDGGGGGGASEAGKAYNGSPNHVGGDGKTWLDGTTYAGGGAGGSLASNSGGAGGGGSSTAGVLIGENGSVNTGGGGSGVGPGAGATSGQGGSGIVIIRYAV